MLTDLLLAIVHHGLAFLLAALVAVELALIRPGLRRDGLKLLGRVDGLYGAVAVGLILVGIGRVVEGLKGWEFYVYYPVFWAKMAALLLVALLSIQPTIRITRWRRADVELVPEAEIRTTRLFLKAQVVGFVLILIFAATMARGYGS